MIIQRAGREAGVFPPTPPTPPCAHTRTKQARTAGVRGLSPQKPPTPTGHARTRDSGTSRERGLSPQSPRRGPTRENYGRQQASVPKTALHFGNFPWSYMWFVFPFICGLYSLQFVVRYVRRARGLRTNQRAGRRGRTVTAGPRRGTRQAPAPVAFHLLFFSWFDFYAVFSWFDTKAST